MEILNATTTLDEGGMAAELIRWGMEFVFPYGPNPTLSAEIHAPTHAADLEPGDWIFISNNVDSGNWDYTEFFGFPLG